MTSTRDVEWVHPLQETQEATLERDVLNALFMKNCFKQNLQLSRHKYKQVNHRKLLIGLLFYSKSPWLRLSSRSRDWTSRMSLEGPGWAAATAAQVMWGEMCISGWHKPRVLRGKSFCFAQQLEERQAVKSQVNSQRSWDQVCTSYELLKQSQNWDSSNTTDIATQRGAAEARAADPLRWEFLRAASRWPGCKKQGVHTATAPCSGSTGCSPHTTSSFHSAWGRHCSPLLAPGTWQLCQPSSWS